MEKRRKVCQRTSAKGKRISRRTVLRGAAALAATPILSRVAWAAPSSVNIGVIQPLSGANAQFGINSRDGIQLVADEINAAGGLKALGGAKLNLLVADSTSTPTTAASVAQRFISQNKVVAILGAYASSLTIAVSDVTERQEIPLFTMSFADELTQRGFKYIFQVVPKASVIGKSQFDDAVAIAAAAGEKVQRVALMYEDTAYGTSQAKGLRAAAKAAGISLVMDESYPHGITDVTPLIDKLRASNAQVAFPVSYLNDSLLIIRSMRQQQLKTPVVGGAAGYVEPDFWKAIGQYAEGVLSIDTSNYDLAPDLTERFRKRFGRFMTHEAIENAALLYVLAHAIDNAKSTDASAIRKALVGHTFGEGWAKAMPGGKVTFDEQGLNTSAFPVMVQWRQGELVTVWPANVAKGKPAWKSAR